MTENARNMVELRLDLPPEVHRYLEWMASTSLWGDTVAEVARSLIREGIRDAMIKGFLPMPPGPGQDYRGADAD